MQTEHGRRQQAKPLWFGLWILPFLDMQEWWVAGIQIIQILWGGHHTGQTHSRPISHGEHCVPKPSNKCTASCQHFLFWKEHWRFDRIRWTSIANIKFIARSRTDVMINLVAWCCMMTCLVESSFKYESSSRARAPWGSGSFFDLFFEGVRPIVTKFLWADFPVHLGGIWQDPRRRDQILCWKELLQFAGQIEMRTK